MTFTLLDGGMGQALMARWNRPPTPLWSVDILQERPDLVEAAHSDFLRAGAEVITLASYPATPTRLARAGREGEFESLQAAALGAAAQARDLVRPDARIAGCLPPLPGSYRPGERLSALACEREYARLVNAQTDGVDLFLCETLGSVEEVRLATRAAKRSGLPVWTSATVDESDGTRLRSLEPLAQAVDAALEEGAEAILVNCSPPEAVDAALPIVATRAGTFGAYANGFTTVAPLKGDATVSELTTRQDLGSDTYADWIESWFAAGATLLGGCCEIGPAHIKELARRRLRLKEQAALQD